MQQVKIREDLIRIKIADHILYKILSIGYPYTIDNAIIFQYIRKYATN